MCVSNVFGLCTWKFLWTSSLSVLEFAVYVFFGVAPSDAKCWICWMYIVPRSGDISNLMCVFGLMHGLNIQDTNCWMQLIFGDCSYLGVCFPKMIQRLVFCWSDTQLKWEPDPFVNIQKVQQSWSWAWFGLDLEHHKFAVVFRVSILYPKKTPCPREFLWHFDLACLEICKISVISSHPTSDFIRSMALKGG